MKFLSCLNKGCGDDDDDDRKSFFLRFAFPLPASPIPLSLFFWSNVLLGCGPIFTSNSQLQKKKSAIAFRVKGYETIDGKEISTVVEQGIYRHISVVVFSRRKCTWSPDRWQNNFAIIDYNETHHPLKRPPHSYGYFLLVWTNAQSFSHLKTLKPGRVILLCYSFALLKAIF